MPNYCLKIEYDGTGFCGWQFQPELRTVQVEVERALKLVFRHTVRLKVAGRTDSGVHALGQYANFKSDVEIEPSLLRKKLNGIMAKDISISNISLKDEKFHCRYSALAREYFYLIYPGKSAVLHGKCWEYLRPLKDDFLKMNELMSCLKGENEFKSFCSGKTVLDHYYCNIFELKWEKKHGCYHFHVKANRFVHHMIRIMVGTCMSIYEGRLPEDHFMTLLKVQNRDYAGKTAPSRGLFLKEVYYPERAL